jgi:hypothetical protein
MYQHQVVYKASVSAPTSMEVQSSISHASAICMEIYTNSF